MAKATPPLAHPDHGKVVYGIVLEDNDLKRYALDFVLDATKLAALLNAMVISGQAERTVKGTPFTVRQRRLGDGKEGMGP